MILTKVLLPEPHLFLSYLILFPWDTKAPFATTSSSFSLFPLAAFTLVFCNTPVLLLHYFKCLYLNLLFFRCFTVLESVWRDFYIMDWRNALENPANHFYGLEKIVVVRKQSVTKYGRTLAPQPPPHNLHTNTRGDWDFFPSLTPLLPVSHTSRLSAVPSLPPLAADSPDKETGCEWGFWCQRDGEGPSRQHTR